VAFSDAPNSLRTAFAADFLPWRRASLRRLCLFDRASGGVVLHVAVGLIGVALMSAMASLLTWYKHIQAKGGRGGSLLDTAN
jgi:hypothetical protein